MYGSGWFFKYCHIRHLNEMIVIYHILYASVDLNWVLEKLCYMLSVNLSLVSQNFLSNYCKVSCNFNEKGEKTGFRVNMPSNLLK